MQISKYRKKVNSLLKQFLVWRAKHIKDRQFIYILSVVTGLLSGLAAVVIKNTVHLVEILLTEGISGVHSFLYFVYPLVGILLSVAFVLFIIRKPVGHGIPNALYAISRGNGNIHKRDTWTSVVTSALTVGLGGSVGLEGPTVATSAALGSNLGQKFKMTRKTKVLLIACASSGALSAIFNAPVAAIVFALEVIMIDLTAVSLAPVLLASISAVLTSRLFLGEETLFHFNLSDPFIVGDTLFYVLLGVVCGLLSVYFTKVYFFVEKYMQKVSNKLVRAILGGTIVGALIFLMPQLYGEGYGLINALIEGDEEKALIGTFLKTIGDNSWSIILFLGVLVMVKAVATSVTLQSGGVGGIFAPTLFMGTTVGYLYAKFFRESGIADLSSSNFTLVAMGGMMAGILHAPLTGVFLIAEITGGYELFLPLMITAAIAFITVKYGVKNSVYTMQLAKRGDLLTHHKDQAVLTLMNLKEEIEQDFVKVHPYDKLEGLVKAVADSKRNLFPVVDEDNIFLGVITLNDIRQIMFDRDQYDKVLVHELMTSAPEYIYYTDSMESVMNKFDRSGAWNLPVIDADNHYVGFVSKSKLFSGYRSRLKDFYDEED